MSNQITVSSTKLGVVLGGLLIASTLVSALVFTLFFQRQMKCAETEAEHQRSVLIAKYTLATASARDTLILHVGGDAVQQAEHAKLFDDALTQEHAKYK
jgi:hypothetical protein